MIINDTEYLKTFEYRLEKDLLKLCTDYGKLEGTMLSCEDIDHQWTVMAPEYMADAVPEVQRYPVVSVAWAMYLGMAVAYGWDADWEKTKTLPYQHYYGKDGFDDMDEHICSQVLGVPLISEVYKDLENLVRRCGEETVAHIRNEHIEPSTPMAFHVFARSTKVMFRIGAALQLRKMGYKMEQVKLS